jgi:hypothetical protein
MGRKLQVTFDYLRNFTSRRPNSSLPSLSSYAVETTILYPVSYSSITISTPEQLTIYQRTSFALLRERIHNNRRKLDHTSRELLQVHLRLASVLSESDWSLIDRLTFNKAIRTEEDSKATQLQKFSRLHKIQHQNLRTSKETVINLSGLTLDDGVSSLLQKGLNYAVTPRTVPIEDILVGVEKAVQSLPVESAEEARLETVRVIKSASKPRDNLNREGSTEKPKKQHRSHNSTSR